MDNCNNHVSICVFVGFVVILFALFGAVDNIVGIRIMSKEIFGLFAIAGNFLRQLHFSRNGYPTHFVGVR